MMYIWLSALLFGMVHPGSKLILNSGLPLDLFCLAYVGIRLLAQFPFVIKTKAYKIEKWSELKIITILGLVGASLQLSEFAGIASGAKISTVTFLVYTHPIWSLLISKMFFNEDLGIVGMLKLIMASLGIYLVVGSENFNFTNLTEHWVSLLAGLLIASWIRISNVARKQGFSTLKTNFYYDLMSFFCILILIYGQNRIENISIFTEYFQIPKNLLLLVSFSILIGLLPNLLFYKGSSNVDSMTAGYILLLEPVIASVTAYIFWNDQISFTFLVGALLILSANIPKKLLQKRLKWVATSFVFIILTESSFAVELKTITLFEIIPLDSLEYVVSSEKKQITTAANLAMGAIKLNKNCHLKLETKLEIGSEEHLVKLVKELAQTPKDRMVLGISRSNFARVAAKATAGTELKAISVGASTSNLGIINKNFMTMVNPWEEQFALVRKVLKENRCSPKETLGVFDSAHYLSQNFLKAYQQLKLGPWVNYSKFESIDLSRRCLFIGLNFAEGATLLNKVKGQQLVIGTGDWNINSSELLTISAKLPRSISIYIPTGWVPEVNSNSQNFYTTFSQISGEAPSPIAAYVYDGVLLSAEALCNNVDIFNQVVNLPLMLRNYLGKNKFGNLLSPMHVKIVKGNK